MKSYIFKFLSVTLFAASSLCFADGSAISISNTQACKDCIACKDCNLACKDCNMACKDCLLACKDCSFFLAALPFSGSQDSKQKYSEINTSELTALINSGKKVIILDARDPKYTDGKMIPGAILLTDDATPDQVKAVIPSKDALVVTYCVGKQCPASEWLADYLVGLGYTNVKRYTEGIEGWVNAGNKVEKSR